jgi:hypothetical protein
MAYLDMEGMEDMEASEIVDMANVQPNVVSPEVVNLDDMGRPLVDEIVNLDGLGQAAPMRRKQLVPSRMMPRGMTQAKAAPNLIVQGLGAGAVAARAGAAAAGNMLRAGTHVNVRLADGTMAGAVLLHNVPVRETGRMTYVALGPLTVQISRRNLPAGTIIMRVPAASP